MNSTVLVQHLHQQLRQLQVVEYSVLLIQMPVRMTVHVILLLVYVLDQLLRQHLFLHQLPQQHQCQLRQRQHSVSREEPVHKVAMNVLMEYVARMERVNVEVEDVLQEFLSAMPLRIQRQHQKVQGIIAITHQ